MSMPDRLRHSLSRRRFLVGGAGAAAALGVYTVGGWIAEESYQPPAIDPAPQTVAAEHNPPGQPIALLIDPTAPASFGLYLAEVLRTEGLNTFQIESLDQLDAGYLANFSLVLLPPAKLSGQQAGALTAYVTGGGALIALQPDPAIAALCGVRPAAGSTADGYLFVHWSNGRVGRTTAGAPLQLHVETPHYTLDGATAIADVYRDRGTATKFPAVTRTDHARGRVVMFAYDLARNIALTRQGNPEVVNQDRDGVEGVRANDLFVDWLDLDNLNVPQADLQARLLVSLIETLLGDRLPLPRLWYFPGLARSMIILTGDAHAVPAPFIEETLSLAESFGGHATVYYTPPDDDGIVNGLRRSLARLPVFGWVAPNRAGRPAPDDVNDWRARGHEFGLHPFVEEGVDEGYVNSLRAFQRDGYAPASPTVRTHRILWHGWVDTARVQARRSFRMNVDYYHVGPAFRAADGSWPAGHFIGSGLPMKFVDLDGQIVDVYQQPTQLVDEHWLATTNRGWAGLDGEQAAQIARGLIDRCLAGAYAALAIQYHMDFTSHDQPDYQNAQRWLNGVLDYAVARGLPIWTAEQWLAFVETRHDTAVTGLRWDDASGTLSFDLNSPRDLDETFTVLLPATFDGRRLSEARVDDKRVAGQTFSTDGREYTGVPVSVGSHTFAITYAAKA